jgi:hypothetical protein
MGDIGRTSEVDDVVDDNTRVEQLSLTAKAQCCSKMRRECDCMGFGNCVSVGSWGGRCHISHVFSLCRSRNGSDDGISREAHHYIRQRHDMLTSGNGVHM